MGLCGPWGTARIAVGTAAASEWGPPNGTFAVEWVPFAAGATKSRAEPHELAFAAVASYESRQSSQPVA